MAATADDMVEAVKQLNLSTNVLIHEQKRNTEEIKKGNKARGAAPSAPSPTMNSLIGSYQNLTGGFRGAAQQFAGGNISGGIKSLLQSSREIGGISSGVTNFLGGGAGAGTASRGAAAIAGAGAAVAVGTVGVVMALNEFKKALDASTASTITNYREMGKWSAQMATIMTQRDVKVMLREMEKGDRLSPYAAQLTQAEQRRADAGKEVEIAWEEFKAGFLTEYQKMMQSLLEVGSDIAKMIRSWMGGKEVIEGPPHLGDQLQQAVDRWDKQAAQQRQNINNAKQNPPPRGI